MKWLVLLETALRRAIVSRLTRRWSGWASGLQSDLIVMGRAKQTQGLPSYTLEHLIKRSGRLRALAITTRSRLLPDVPSLAEAGYPEIGKDDWVGVFVPARTPKEIVIALNRSIATIIASTDATERMATLGFEPLASTPEEFRARIGVEIDTWGKMIRATHIKAE
jgi:tripartite-type tricarboxylate transporter receptor subunit TctC